VVVVAPSASFEALRRIVAPPPFPKLSRACTVTVLQPLFAVIEHDPDGPETTHTSTPFRKKRSSAIPEASVAPALTVKVLPTPAPDAGEVIVTFGEVVSPKTGADTQGWVVPGTVTSDERFPSASNAWTPMV